MNVSSFHKTFDTLWEFYNLSKENLQHRKIPKTQIFHSSTQNRAHISLTKPNRIIDKPFPKQKSKHKGYFRKAAYSKLHHNVFPFNRGHYTSIERKMLL